MSKVFRQTPKERVDHSQVYNEEFWGGLDSCLIEMDFHGAEVYVNSYFSGREKDDVYFYAMADIYNTKAVTFDSIDDERMARDYIESAIKVLDGDPEWRDSVADLWKRIEDNLNLLITGGKLSEC